MCDDKVLLVLHQIIKEQHEHIKELHSFIHQTQMSLLPVLMTKDVTQVASQGVSEQQQEMNRMFMDSMKNMWPSNYNQQIHTAAGGEVP